MSEGTETITPDQGHTHRHRGVLWVGALVVLIGALVGTTEAMAPSAHTTKHALASHTQVPEHSPAVSTSHHKGRAPKAPLRPDGPVVTIQNQVTDGFGLEPVSGSPSCSANGQTCLAAEAQVFGGGIRLLMSNDGGRSWTSGTIPRRSDRQAGTIACEPSVCYLTTFQSKPISPPSPGVSIVSAGSRVRACRIDAITHTVACNVVASYPDGVLAVSCVGNHRCTLMREHTTALGRAISVRLYALAPSGVGAVLTQPVVVQTGLCPAGNCDTLGANTIEGTASLSCSPAGCATTVGVSEVLWLHLSARVPSPAIVRTVLDTSLVQGLPGLRPALPMTDVGGPYRRVQGKSSCDLFQSADSTGSLVEIIPWCPQEAQALPDGDFGWLLVANSKTQGGHREAWIVTKNGIRWKVVATQPSAVVETQASGATDQTAAGVGQWCNRNDSVCVIARFHPSLPPSSSAPTNEFAGGSLTVQRFAR